MRTLQPPIIPKPAAIPIWDDDYTDIQSRILKYGYIDRDEVWLPNSDDGWSSFCSRHGHINFHLTHNELRDKFNFQKRPEQSKAYQLQLQWEEHYRQRRQEQQAASDKEWKDIEDAKAFWSKVHIGYAKQNYNRVKITTIKYVYGYELQVGQSYWLPWSVAQSI